MTKQPVVLVDARNVLRSRWPNIPERKLVELVERWAEREALDAVVVFDGPAPKGVSGRAEVIGTGAESADDWIARAGAGYVSEGRPYWLVTSDRALREAVGRAEAREFGGGAFAGTLLHSSD